MRPWVICTGLLVLYLAAICSVQADSDESDSDEKRDRPRKRSRLVSSARRRAFRIGAKRYQRGSRGSSRARAAYSSRSGRKDRAFCLDLTILSTAFPDDSKWFSFTPTRRVFTPCFTQGIIRIKVPPWVKQFSSLAVQMTFDQATRFGWKFHIGDTESNTAKNTDMVPGQGAQIVDDDGTLKVYMNSQYMNTKFVDTAWYSAGVYIQVFKHDLFFTDHDWYTAYDWPGGSNRFFSFPEDDYIYMGVNRIIASESNGDPYDGRDGQGLCTVCLWWNE